jgi:hypothetical protein
VPEKNSEFQNQEQPKIKLTSKRTITQEEKMDISKKDATKIQQLAQEGKQISKI